MKATAIILALISLLIITGCTEKPLGALSLNDYQREYFESQTATEYYTYASAYLHNTTYTDDQNTSKTLAYGNSTSIGRTDIGDVNIYSPGGTEVTSGNYTVNHEDGTITLDEPKKIITANESMVLVYGTRVNYTNRDWGVATDPAPIIIDQTDLWVVPSGNYSVNYNDGVAGITLTSYKKVGVLNETINCSSRAEIANVTYRVYGVSEAPAVRVFDKTSNATIPSTNYTFHYDTGYLVCLANNAYKNQNVGIDYNYNNITWKVNTTYYYNNDSWPVNVVYDWYNKIRINCTPDERTSSNVLSFVKSIKFLTLTGTPIAQLWKGEYVVNADDGLSTSSNNLLGKGTYVNETGIETLNFGKPEYSGEGQFSIRLSSGNTNGTLARVNVVCKYK